MDFSAYDNLSTGILAVDVNMKIIYCNEPYASFLKRPKEELYGMDFREFIPQTRLPEVLEKGITLGSDWQKTPVGYMFGNRIPLWEDGKIVGVLAELILKDAKEIDDLAMRLSETEVHLRILRQSVADAWSSEKKASLVFRSASMNKLMETVFKVAPLDTTVLITGETGCGKEVVMEHLYRYSGRTDYPLVKINCAAIPSELLESELFGYERGAFTGALDSGKIGKFELANHGVLFLDEISSMPLTMQSKLLRVLQDKEIEPLGSTKRKPVDVKIIAATNEDLRELVQQNRFRQDLFYRLNVIDLHVPPLRKRQEDIIPLCNHFLSAYFKRFGKDSYPLSPAAARHLEHYAWPGNVRELKNVMERLAIMCEGPQITCTDLLAYTPIHDPEFHSLSLNEQIMQYEKQLIINALKHCQGNKAAAAAYLGINRTTLYSKLEKYHITDGVD